MSAFTEFDRWAMARALALADRGAETTHPNPRVGCVIARSGKIIAEGWHERAGGPHAEAAALQAAVGLEGGATGTTAYVTLEPCNHQGRTPPCATALIAAKVARVVMAVRDPNPAVTGGGAEALREAGIQVDEGLMADEAQEQNLGFLLRMRTGVPHVRVKMAMSLDGRTALANGASQWITSDAAREDVQWWRARSSAILTGIGTVLADDPRLNVRRERAWRQPLRVVLDTRLRTPVNAQVLDASVAPTLILTASQDAEAAAALTAGGAQIESVPAAGGLDLRAVLARLGELGVNDLLVEAGATLSGELVRQGLANELLIYMAPRLLGPHARPLLSLPLLDDLQYTPRFNIIEHRVIGEDMRLRLRPRA